MMDPRLPVPPTDRNESAVREADPHFKKMQALETWATKAHLTLQFVDAIDVAPNATCVCFYYQLVPAAHAKRAWSDCNVEAVQVESNPDRGITYGPKEPRFDVTALPAGSEATTRVRNYRSLVQRVLGLYSEKALTRGDMLHAVYWLLTSIQDVIQAGVAPAERHPTLFRTRVILEALKAGMRPVTRHAKKSSRGATYIELHPREECGTFIEVVYTAGRKVELWWECGIMPPEEEDDLAYAWIARMCKQHPSYSDLLDENNRFDTWAAARGIDGTQKPTRDLWPLLSGPDSLAPWIEKLGELTRLAKQDMAQTVVSHKPTTENGQAYLRTVEEILQGRLTRDAAENHLLQASLKEGPLREMAVHNVFNFFSLCASHPRLPIFVAYAEDAPGGPALLMTYSRDGSPLIGREAEATMVWQPSDDPTRVNPDLSIRTTTRHAEDEKPQYLRLITPEHVQQLRAILNDCTTVRTWLLNLPAILEILRTYDDPKMLTVKEWQRKAMDQRLLGVVPMSAPN